VGTFGKHSRPPALNARPISDFDIYGKETRNISEGIYKVGESR
jgi:hypothetical protein